MVTSDRGVYRRPAQAGRTLRTLIRATMPGQLHDRGTDVIGQIQRRHRDLAVVRLSEIASHPVEIDGELAGRLGVKELTEPCGDHPAEHVAGPPCRHAGVARWVDEDLLVGGRDE